MSTKFNDSAWRRRLMQCEYTVPTTIGFKNKPKYKHGMIKEFFKFFYMQDSSEPQGNFKDMADAVHDRYGGNLDKHLASIGDEAQQMHDYLSPPDNKEPDFDWTREMQSGAAESILKYMDKANKLSKKIYNDTSKSGAPEEKKVIQGLKGILSIVKLAKNIFTSSFGGIKRRRIGFRFGRN